MMISMPAASEYMDFFMSVDTNSSGCDALTQECARLGRRVQYRHRCGSCMRDGAYLNGSAQNVNTPHSFLLPPSSWRYDLLLSSNRPDQRRSCAMALVHHTLKTPPGSNSISAVKGEQNLTYVYAWWR